MSYTAAVITVSDKGYAGERVDTSGPAVRDMLEKAGYEVVSASVVPDELDMIKAELIRCADEKISLAVTTGGTGFSPRDVTPEATLAVVERETRGIPELMRAESMKITPRGCLSRAAAGIRGGTLIVNLPGSEKAARENLQAVLPALDHGLKMLASAGSAECASQADTPPSADAWLREAKREMASREVGMYLIHNGVVRLTPREQARGGRTDLPPVAGMEFSYDAEKVEAAIRETYDLDGIKYVRVWLNRGRLSVGDDIMYVLIGGDIRPHVVAALESLVGKIKSECVSEREIYA
jgi:molybdenum cofactor synthesis domain-containing protein